MRALRGWLFLGCRHKRQFELLPLSVRYALGCNISVLGIGNQPVGGWCLRALRGYRCGVRYLFGLRTLFLFVCAGFVFHGMGA